MHHSAKEQVTGLDREKMARYRCVRLCCHQETTLPRIHSFHVKGLRVSDLFLSGSTTLPLPAVSASFHLGL